MVLVLASNGQRIDIPDGCIFENREPLHSPVIMNGCGDNYFASGLLSGNLNVTVGLQEVSDSDILM